MRAVFVAVGACAVIAGGTVAGLVATGSAGSAGGRGAPAGAVGGTSDPSGAARLNVTSPAPVHAPRTQSPRSRSASAPSARATPAAAAGHQDPFGPASASYLSGRAGTVLAAVYDLRTGRSWHLGQGPPQAEASIVKLDVLETLLAERADGGGTSLSASDQTLAEQMIEDSDNDAATSLWYAVGGAASIRSFNARAGLTDTAPSSLTTTTPDDQIALLRQLVTTSSVLPRAAREYALSLMEDVTPSQRWGVSGGVPAQVTVALKNGWLPLHGTGSDWQINSVGWISGAGRNYLMAVLSTGNPSEQYGIDTIDELAAMAWQRMG